MPAVSLGPEPCNPYPLAATKQVAFLKPVIDHPMIEVGEYTYYDDPDGPEHFVDACVKYHFEHMGDRLMIGRFCAIAAKVKFIMNGANHALHGFSTYPFSIFKEGWEQSSTDWSKGSRGDTKVGNDVWIGTHAVILPGVTIGDGAIIGAYAVVTRDVPPYGVAVGNPAQVVKRRFPEEITHRLCAIAWWDWPREKITRYLPAICSANIADLERAAFDG